MNDLPVSFHQNVDDYYLTLGPEYIHASDNTLELDATGPYPIAPQPIGQEIGNILFGG